MHRVRLSAFQAPNIQPLSHDMPFKPKHKDRRISLKCPQPLQSAVLPCPQVHVFPVHTCLGSTRLLQMILCTIQAHSFTVPCCAGASAPAVRRRVEREAGTMFAEAAGDACPPALGACLSPRPVLGHSLARSMSTFARGPQRHRYTWHATWCRALWCWAPAGTPPHAAALNGVADLSVVTGASALQADRAAKHA